MSQEVTDLSVKAVTVQRTVNTPRPSCENTHTHLHRNCFDDQKVSFYFLTPIMWMKMYKTQNQFEKWNLYLLNLR